MSNYSRFIPGEEIDEVSRWRFGDVDAAAQLLAAQRQQMLRDEQAQALRQEGYAEGFVQGRAQALLDAQRQISDFMATQGEETSRQMAALLDAARAQLEQAEKLAAQAVLALSASLARQVLRHEIATNPNVLLPVIREALEILMTDHQAARVRLNPQDLDVIKEAVQAEFPHVQLMLLADANVQRGGCWVDAQGAVVDGRIERRWAKAIANLDLTQSWEGADDSR